MGGLHLLLPPPVVGSLFRVRGNWGVALGFGVFTLPRGSSL